MTKDQAVKVLADAEKAAQEFLGAEAPPADGPAGGNGGQPRQDPPPASDDDIPF